MAKINFTGLVSGMSGKIQGSVLATNNGGAYMRNNTSKVKPQTAANGKRKASFSKVSQAWRSLTFEQQEAWKLAAPEYQKTNVFGKLRTPTGFELYMRLNSALATFNRPQLVMPPAPPVLPDPGRVDLDFPDLFQFTPQAFATTGNRNNPGQTAYFQTNNILTSGPLVPTAAFSLIVNFAGVPSASIPAATPIRIFQYAGSSNSYVRVELVDVNSSSANVRVTIGTDTNNWAISTQENEFSLLSPQSLLIRLVENQPDETEIYIQGVSAYAEAIQTGTFANATAAAQVTIGNATPGNNQSFAFSDFRYYNTVTSAENIKLIAKGYVIGNETLVVPFTVPFANGNYRVGIGDTTAYFTRYGSSLTWNTAVPMSAMHVPAMLLTTENEGAENVFLNIYASGPVSNGRGGAFSAWKQIAQLPFESNQVFDVSNQWAAVFGAFVPGSNILFKLEVFDANTGVIPAAISKPKRKARFKAGAELSAHVN